MKNLILVLSFALLLSGRVCESEQRGSTQNNLPIWEDRMCLALQLDNHWAVEQYCDGAYRLSSLLANSIDHKYPDRIKLVQLAISLGMDPSLDSNRLLFYAIISLDLPVLRILVSSGANLELKFHSYTPLHLTVRYPFIEGTRLLVSSGSNIDTPSGYTGKTALHYAAEIGNIDIAQILIQAGANVNLVDRFTNSTALHHVVVFKEWEPMYKILNRVMLCNLLIDVGADRKIKNKNGETAPQLAKKHSYYGIRNCADAE